MANPSTGGWRDRPATRTAHLDSLRHHGGLVHRGHVDPDPEIPDRYVGSANRLAVDLARYASDAGQQFGYANLAVRGRLLADVVGPQLDAALALEPDLVSIVGGGNDILRPSADVDGLAGKLEDAVVRIRATGADVLMVTPFDPVGAPLVRATRGRAGAFAALVWGIAQRHGARVLDQWSLVALRGWRMSADDRIHMTAGSPPGRPRRTLDARPRHRRVGLADTPAGRGSRAAPRSHGRQRTVGPRVPRSLGPAPAARRVLGRPAHRQAPRGHPARTEGRLMDPFELYAIDGLLTDEERAIRDTVRDFGTKELRPHVATWFDEGRVPARHLAKQLGGLGILGMHLEGYGCAGTGAVAYGLACQEMEAVDSGLRSLVSVQGSLAMYAIHAYGSEEQKREWLPGMAAGEKLGCFGLTEPDAGSNPASMRTAAKRDASGKWVLNGTKLWITNGSVADVAVVWARTDDRIRGFVVPTATKGFSANEIHQKLSLRASVTSELVFDDLRLPADAVLPGAAGLGGPAGVPQRGPVRDHFRLFGRRPRQPRDRFGLRSDARGVRQAPRRIPAHPAEVRRHGGRARQRHAPGDAPRPVEGGRDGHARAG